MGRNLLEQEPGKIPGPATEQKAEEISLARELRGMIDEVLGGIGSKFFDFSTQSFYVIRPHTFVASVIDGQMVFGAVEGSLLDSWEWPKPEWKPTSAEISRGGDEYTIKVNGYRDLGGVPDHGVCLTLKGTYPRIDNIVPGGSQAATMEEKRRDPNQNLFPDIFYPSYPTTVKIPARDGRLRPRIERLKYGIFMVNRIKAANSGAKVLP